MTHIKRLVTLLIFAIPATILPFVGSTRELVIVNEYGDNENIESTVDQPFEGTFEPLGLGAASDIVLTALYQNVPLLIPAALWNNIIAHKQLFEAMASKPLHELKKTYGKTELFKTAQALKTFKAQCEHAHKLHKHLKQNLSHSHSFVALKEALYHDPVNKNCSAPSSLKDNWLGWEHVMQYVMCSIVELENFSIFKLHLKNVPECPYILFIPKQILGSLPSHNKTSTLSAREIALGLKIDHCTPITTPFESIETSFDNAQLDLMPKVLDKLFVHNHEVPQAQQQQWCLYMMGHGIYNQAAKDRQNEIKRAQRKSTKSWPEHQKEYNDLRLDNIFLGMPLDIAQKMFEFLNNQINTKAFFLTSCSSGGQQAVDTFCNTNGSPLKLSFPVITDTLAEAPLLRAIPHLALYALDEQAPNAEQLDLSRLIDWETKKIILDTPYDFELLFKLAREKNITQQNMDLMLRSFAPTHQCNQYNTVPAAIRKNCKRMLTSECSLYTNNHITIRLPGSSTFSLIGPAQLVCTNTTRGISCHTPLILLDAATIPGTITITQKETSTCPAIVSAVPGKAKHCINALQTDYKLSEILAALTSCQELHVPKCIHIKELVCCDDCIKTNNKKSTFTDVYCFMSNNLGAMDASPTNHIVMTSQHKTYHYCWNFNQSLLEYDFLLFDTLTDPRSLIASLIEPFTEHHNSEKKFIKNVLTTAQLKEVIQANE